VVTFLVKGVAPERSFTPPAPPFSPFWFINRQRGNRLNYDLLKIHSIGLTATENNFQKKNKEERKRRKKECAAAPFGAAF
jgi:hypothetical protein